MGIPTEVGEIGILVHSVDYVFKCKVCINDGSILQISPNEKEVDVFQTNDPVVIMYMDEGFIQICSGDIVSVDISDKSAKIVLKEIDTNEEKSIYERYPVSMAVSARRKFSNKRLGLIAKNISQYGMQAISNIDLEQDESIDMDLITGKYMFYFVGKVIWKREIGAGFEYYFQLTNFDVSTKSAMEAYLGKLKEEYRNMYKKAK